MLSLSILETALEKPSVSTILRSKVVGVTLQGSVSRLIYPNLS
ncbi:hypothetical protein LINPERHAP2_LOCUS4586 [Linum perenne]